MKPKIKCYACAILIIGIIFSTQARAAQMFFIDIDQQGIYRANLDGTSLTRVMSINVTFASLSVEVDSDSQRLYWAERDTDNRIMSANYDGSDIQVVVDTDLTRVLDLEFDSINPKLYWTDQLTHSVGRSDPDGGNRETVLTIDDARMSHLALDVPNNRMFMTGFNGNKVYQSDLSGNEVYELINVGSGDIWDVEYDAITDSLYIHDEDNGELHRVPLNDSEIYSEELVTENWHPHGAEIDSANGRIYYSNNKTRRIEDPFIAQIESRKLDGTDPQVHINGLTNITGMAIDFVIPTPSTGMIILVCMSLVMRRSYSH